jgi:hypothetical protein
MSIKEGTKMLYCKVDGDKSTEEVVDILYVHSEAAGGGVTIYIPSLKRERDTIVSRLVHIVEKKDKIDNYFGKPRLELPGRLETSCVSKMIDGYFKQNHQNTENPRKDIWTNPYLQPNGAGGPRNLTLDEVASHESKYGILWRDGVNQRNIIGDIYDTIERETQHARTTDEVLLDNQRLLFNQLNSLQETIKIQQRKTPPPSDEELQREIAELRKMNAHHRQINAQLLSSQREMREEMLVMREEMSAMRLFIEKYNK